MLKPKPSPYPEFPILNVKQGSHGDYRKNAMVAQHVKHVIHTYAVNLSDSQKESLDLIGTKIGRICAGDPCVIDHWEDIAGYANLIVAQLKQVQGAKA